MSLPQFNTSDRILSMMQSRWASQLDPVVENPLLKGVILKDVTLAIGDNTVDHKLQRVPQGYLVIDMKDVFSQIFRKESSMPTLNIILNSSALTVVTLYVF